MKYSLVHSKLLNKDNKSRNRLIEIKWAKSENLRRLGIKTNYTYQLTPMVNWGQDFTLAIYIAVGHEEKFSQLSGWGTGWRFFIYFQVVQEHEKFQAFTDIQARMCTVDDCKRERGLLRQWIDATNEQFTKKWIQRRGQKCRKCSLSKHHGRMWQWKWLSEGMKRRTPGNLPWSDVC